MGPSRGWGGGLTPSLSDIACILLLFSVLLGCSFFPVVCSLSSFYCSCLLLFSVDLGLLSCLLLFSVDLGLYIIVSSVCSTSCVFSFFFSSSLLLFMVDLGCLNEHR